MRESPRWFGKQSTLVLVVLAAAACATQMQDPEDEVEIIPGTPNGMGGDTGGTPMMGTGGSLDQMMGTGGTMLPMGGTPSSGGTGGKASGGAGMTGKGGNNTGGKGGSGTGGAMAGKGGSSAGMMSMGGMGTGGSSGGRGGTTSMGGAGTGSGGRAAAGQGGMTTSGGRSSTGGMTSGGRSSTGGMSAGGSAGTGSGEGCPNPRDPAMPGAAQGNSGSFMTKNAVCYFVEGTFNAWDCSNLGGRTVTVNGKAGACGAALPAKVDGGYYFDFTSSPDTDYTSFFWYTQ
jgi:hypothetical protein